MQEVTHATRHKAQGGLIAPQKLTERNAHLGANKAPAHERQRRILNIMSVTIDVTK